MKFFYTLILSFSLPLLSFSFFPMGKYLDSNIRLTLGGYGSLRPLPSSIIKYDTGGGLSDLGGGVALSLAFLNILEIGADIKVGATNPGRLFSSDERIKVLSGPSFETDALVRVLLPLGLLDLGGQVLLSWGKDWIAFKREEIGEHVPGWWVRVGPVLRFNFTEFVSLYTGLNYSLKNIKFNTDKLVDDLSYMKTLVNKHGIEIPLGIAISFGYTLGAFAQVDTFFESLSEIGGGYKGTLSAGITISI